MHLPSWHAPEYFISMSPHHAHFISHRELQLCIMHVTRAPKSLNRVDLVVTDDISIQCLASLTTNIENYRHNYKMYINILFYSRGSTVESKN